MQNFSVGFFDYKILCPFFSNVQAAAEFRALQYLKSSSHKHVWGTSALVSCSNDVSFFE